LLIFWRRKGGRAAPVHDPTLNELHALFPATRLNARAYWVARAAGEQDWAPVRAKTCDLLLAPRGAVATTVHDPHISLGAASCAVWRFRLGETSMRYLEGGGSIWTLVKPMAGVVVVGVLALAAVGVFMGIAGAIIGFASWAAVRVLPILAVAALVYWIARESGILNRLRR
jgi:hypothetical protein